MVFGGKKSMEKNGGEERAEKERKERKRKENICKKLSSYRCFPMSNGVLTQGYHASLASVYTRRNSKRILAWKLKVLTGS